MAYTDSGNNKNLELIQEQISVNNLMIEEIELWIRVLEKIKTMKEYDDDEILTKTAKTHGKAFEDLLKSMKLDLGGLESTFGRLSQILKDENKDLTELLKDVKIKSYEVSIRLFNSIVNYNQTQYQLIDSLGRKWSKFFTEISKVIGAIQSVETDDYNSIANSISGLIDEINNEHTSKEEVTQKLIQIMKNLNKLSNLKSDLESAITSKDEKIKKFVKRYYGSQNMTSNMKNSSKIKIFSDKGYNGFDSKDHDDKKNIEEFAKDSLLNLFSGENDLTDKIEKIFGKKKKGHDDENELSTTVKNSIKNYFNQLNASIQLNVANLNCNDNISRASPYIELLLKALFGESENGELGIEEGESERFENILAVAEIENEHTGEFLKWVKNNKEQIKSNKDTFLRFLQTLFGIIPYEKLTNL